MSTSTPQPVITASDNDRAIAALFIAKPDYARDIIEQACFLALRREVAIQRRNNLEQAKKIVYDICGETLAQEIAASPGVQEIHTYLEHLDELIDTHYYLGRATGVFRRVAKDPDTSCSQRKTMFNQLLNNYAAAVLSTMRPNTTGSDSTLHQLNDTFFDTWWDSLKLTT